MNYTQSTLAFSLLLCLLSTAPSQAAELSASDGKLRDAFGYSVSISGDIGIIGAYRVNGYTGLAYAFHNLDTAGANASEDSVLAALNVDDWQQYGWAVSLSGSTALVGAYGDEERGSAFVFRNLTGTDPAPAYSTKLTASDRNKYDNFGRAVSLSGNTALVGASGGKSAYLFRNLDSAGSTKTQDVKLTASSGSTGSFGGSVSLSGNMALVGNDPFESQGRVYVFRDLDIAGATKKEDGILVSSDRANYDGFGSAVSLSGDTALVGADSHDRGAILNAGAAYLFRNLNNISGSRQQDVKLVASDAVKYGAFGSSVSLSENGETALVGAYGSTTKGVNSGAAYLFLNLGSAPAEVTETVKIVASNGVEHELFGGSVSLDGDNFLIGANQAELGYEVGAGRAFYGSVSAITRLDVGSTQKRVSGLSFITQEDWIIGQNTSQNAVTLDAGDSADVSAAGKAVYIGERAGSNENTLRIDGILRANGVYIGSALGNRGNTLVFGSEADVSETGLLRLAAANYLVFEGVEESFLMALLSGASGVILQGWDIESGEWSTVDEANFDQFMIHQFDDLSQTLSITAIPEAGSVVLLIIAGGAVLLGCRRVRLYS